MRPLSFLLRNLTCVLAALFVPPLLLPAAPAAAQGCGVDEWLCHKTADGLHPDGDEQALLWLMNRARLDPAAAGAFLAGLDDPGIVAAIDFYDVDLGVLQDEFAAIAPKPPAAFDRRLYTAAIGHANLMIAENDDDPACGSMQLPPCQLDRVAGAGFFFVGGGLRGNSFGFAPTPLFAHAAWNIDWGPFFSPTVYPGMFPGRVHRKGVMSDPDATVTQVLTNVGVAIVDTAGQPTSLGPLVVVANYARANDAASGLDLYNRFLVGTVWDDLDEDGVYDPGEGLGGVLVATDGAAWTATTAPGGGYAIPILDAGPLEVTFSGGGVPTYTTDVVVGTESALLDYEVPEPAGALAAVVACASLAALRRSRRQRRTRTLLPSITSRPSAKRRTDSGTKRRSTCCTRAASASGVSSSSTGTASCRMIGPVS
jgi:hypothetical protein